MSIEHELRLCNVSYQEAPGYPSFFVSRSLVKPDWTWTVYINGHLVDQSVPPITSIPPCSTGETAVVLQKINTLKIFALVIQKRDMLLLLKIRKISSLCHTQKLTLILVFVWSSMEILIQLQSGLPIVIC